jgi:hypothetical protein
LEIESKARSLTQLQLTSLGTLAIKVMVDENFHTNIKAMIDIKSDIAVSRIDLKKIDTVNDLIVLYL